jgi:hypothetical protein
MKDRHLELAQITMLCVFMLVLAQGTGTMLIKGLDRCSISARSGN